MNNSPSIISTQPIIITQNEYLESMPQVFYQDLNEQWFNSNMSLNLQALNGNDELCNDSD